MQTILDRADNETAQIIGLSPDLVKLDFARKPTSADRPLVSVVIVPADHRDMTVVLQYGKAHFLRSGAAFGPQ